VFAIEYFKAVVIKDHFPVLCAETLIIDNGEHNVFKLNWL